MILDRSTLGHPFNHRTPHPPGPASQPASNPFSSPISNSYYIFLFIFQQPEWCMDSFCFGGSKIGQKREWIVQLNQFFT